MTKELTREERQSRLVQASRDYVNGKISAQEFEEAERQLMPNYLAAAKAIAKTRIGSPPRRESSSREAPAT